MFGLGIYLLFSAKTMNASHTMQSENNHTPKKLAWEWAGLEKQYDSILSGSIVLA